VSAELTFIEVALFLATSRLIGKLLLNCEIGFGGFWGSFFSAGGGLGEGP